MGKVLDLVNLSGEVMRGSPDSIGKLLGVTVAIVTTLVASNPNPQMDATARARAAESFLAEANRRYRSRPLDDGWKDDLRRARDLFIEARAWQQEHGIDDVRLARTELLLVATSAPLPDADGVDHWLRQAARTLRIDPTEDVFATMRRELPQMGEDDLLLGPVARQLTEEQTPPRTSTWGRLVGWLEDIGFIQHGPFDDDDDDWNDPRRDPIGWG